jgi:hypothetical protein
MHNATKAFDRQRIPRGHMRRAAIALRADGCDMSWVTIPATEAASPPIVPIRKRAARPPYYAAA